MEEEQAKGFKFVVEGEPVGKGRPRWSKNHMFTPEKTRQYEELVRLAYRAAGGVNFGEKAKIGVVINACFKIPKSYQKGKRLAARYNINRPTKRPDCDNIMKCILDGLNGVAYADDAQVVEATCRKLFSTSEGYVYIWLYEIKP